MIDDISPLLSQRTLGGLSFEFRYSGLDFDGKIVTVPVVKFVHPTIQKNKYSQSLNKFIKIQIRLGNFIRIRI